MRPVLIGTQLLRAESQSPLARCQTGACVVPCSSDAHGPELRLRLCHESRCTFAGCESNDESRILLNLSNQPGSDRAVCRLPDR